MKGFMKRLENMFVAATFAEAGEFETARDVLRENKRSQQVERPRSDKEHRAPGMRR